VFADFSQTFVSDLVGGCYHRVVISGVAAYFEVDAIEPTERNSPGDRERGIGDDL